MSSGAMADTTGMAGAGTAAVTSPAPTRMAASDVMAGAPALPPADPNVPPTTRTWPKLPLLTAAARGACTSSMEDPAQSMPVLEISNSSGEPMGATTIGWSQARVNAPNTCAGLGAVNVITASAGKTGVSTVALVASAGQPDGKSTASTGRCLFLIHLSASSARPLIGGLN